MSATHQIEKCCLLGLGIFAEQFPAVWKALGLLPSNFHPLQKNIDTLWINAHHVGEINKYADKMLRHGAYDELKAEYMAKRRKE